MKSEPAISVIIPTYNRSGRLRRTLDALSAQTYPLQQAEVLVVADGCTDGTLEMLRHYSASFALRVLEQPNSGPAVARNWGAAHAIGRLLLFLDDDVEPTPALIEAHARAHQCQHGQVVIGPYLPAFLGTANFFGIELQVWWDNEFHAMRQGGHRYTYRDLLGGNFSLAAELFARVGGLDPAFRCHEDHEFGVRLIKGGVPFTFAADAMGHHHMIISVDWALQRMRQEGRADVLIGRRHPELRPALRLARFDGHCSSLSRTLRTLAFVWPAGGDMLAACLRCPVALLDWAKLRDRWRQLWGDLCDYWYWRGVAEELETTEALADFVRGGLACADEDDNVIELDLREGLEAAERRLDRERPASARIHYGQQPVGAIPSKPGAERLQGRHLRPILATDLAVPLLKALALEGEIARSTGLDWPGSSLPIEAWIRQLKEHKAWLEDQQNQWEQWNRLEEEKRAYWARLTRIRELEQEKASLEAEWNRWQRLAEGRERVYRQQQARIRELEREKAGVEEEWRYWKSLAEE